MSTVGGSSKSLADSRKDGSVLRQHGRLAVARGQDDGEATAAGPGHVDDLSRPQAGHDRCGSHPRALARDLAGPPRADRFASASRPQYSSKSPRWQARLRPVPGERPPGRARADARAHDAPVGQELRERRVQELVRLFAVVVAHQVDRHVVRGTERRVEVIRARGGEARDPFERDLPLVDDDGMTQRVDAPPPARPVSCVYSPGVRSSWRSPWNFQRSSITTVLAGMLMPSDSVSVAKTTLTSPASNSSSTVSLNTGSIPA